ncbi:hypothetical protein [Blastococcus litoris]|uniref:hypothetical protein n=1 Tax=Blastococcus litoris TaxID=2171622 RepID=UPI000E300440|nr:hypothetical protein [Blastococcus litoris]
MAEQVVTLLGGAPADEPAAPVLPVTPGPATAIGGAGCGTQGAGSGTQTGAPGSATAVLGSFFSLSLASQDAGLTAPATGSPTTTATDPGTRPD